MTAKMRPRQAFWEIMRGNWASVNELKKREGEAIIAQCVKDGQAELLADARKLEGFVRQVNVIHGYEEGLDLLADWREKYGEGK